MNINEDGEEEWIESPGGWGDGAEGAVGEQASNNTNTNTTSKDDENDENTDSGKQDEDASGMFMDLFANTDPRDTFRFDIVGAAENNSSSSSDKNNPGDEDPPANSNLTAKTTIELKGFKLESDETAQSTGVTLWQAAPRLATYIVQQQHQQSYNIDNDTSMMPLRVAGCKVLELGAGLGLCGIVAHHLGAAQVVMTDGDTQTLKQMRENVQDNPCQNHNNHHNNATTSTSSIVCRQLLWGSSTHMDAFQNTYGRFDIILGADVIYTQESTDPLFDTVVDLLQKPTGRFVLSRYTKWNDVSDDIVLAAAKARGLGCTQPQEGIFVFFFLSC